MNEVLGYENETAHELYEKIQKEKERLISEGKLKKQKKLPEITEDEIPFKIPETWKWVRLGECVLLIDGLNVENVKLPYLEVKYLRGKIEAKIKDSGKYVNKNEHIILVDGENSGEIFLTKEEGILGSTFKIIRFLFKYDKYLIHYLDLNRSLFKSSKKGAAVPHLDKMLFNGLIMPLPPLSEQKRIADKIDRLFEKLDKAKEKALSALSAFESRKAKILHLAVGGKLSKGNYKGETAHELYEKIQKEKERLISEGKLKKQKKLPEITEDEIPFKIPGTWKWVRLGECVLLIDGLNVENVKLPYLEVKYLRGKIEAKIKDSGKYVNKNEHIILVDGENSGEIFLTKEEGILGSTFKIIRFLFKYDKYLIHYLDLNRSLFKSSKKGAAVPHLDKMLFNGLIMPLPPLSEQKEIVKLLDSIFEKEEKVKKQIESVLDKIELIKKSILARAVRGEI